MFIMDITLKRWKCVGENKNVAVYKNLFMIKRADLLYNMKPLTTFFLTLVLGATGIPRLLNRNFISGGILLFVFIVSSYWGNDLLIWIGVFDAVKGLFIENLNQKRNPLRTNIK